MRSLILFSLFFWSLISGSFAQEAGSQEFKQKLSKLYYNTNESIKILRDQISENQLAPFLPNLFLELGNLLNKKSSILYYINKEKGIELTEKSKEFAEIESVAKEAAGVYEKILAEFPRFDNKAQVLYSLAVTYKSLGSTPEFYKYSDRLRKEFPQEKNTFKIMTLLGSELLKKGLVDEAFKVLKIVSKCPFKFEANQARIKIAQALELQKKFKLALALYKKVIIDNTDPILDDDAAIERKLQNISLSDDVKRDALLGSTKVFPYVFPKNPKPIEYYSSFVPSEKLFQDAIEKLAYRYVALSKYDEAITLFRKLSERIASPEKVINIYRDVLSRIPLKTRALFPVEEAHFLMKKFNEWRSYYNPPRPVYVSAYKFFEKHLRDISTRRHNLAKRTDNLAEKKKESNKKLSRKFKKFTDKNLVAAQELYQLYLSYFPDSKLIPKIRYNLADTYFRSGDFPKCAETYIEVYKRFKKPVFLEKAVYCLSQDYTADFYESKRSKGLLIYSLSELMRIDPKRKKDPKSKFFLLKAKFDQGLFEEVLPELRQFIQSNSRSQYASSASDIVIDYYNTKGDYNALSRWAKDFQSVKFATSGYNSKLRKIENQAKLKLLNSKIESFAPGDGDLLTGANYLQSAMNLEDKELQSLALKNAFVKSKTDEDMKTFFKTALILADKASDPAEKNEIFSLMARENMKIGHFEEGQKIYGDLLDKTSKSTKSVAVFEEYFSYLILMRDFDELTRAVSSPLYKSIKKNLKDNLRSLVFQAFSSPVQISEDATETLISALPKDLDLGLALFKLSARFESDKTKAIQSQLVRNRCLKGNVHVFCGWSEFEATARSMKQFVQDLENETQGVDSLEKYAVLFEKLVTGFGRFKGRDPAYDMLASIHESLIYTAFGVFIQKVADTSSELKSFLGPRAQELLMTGKKLQGMCRQIATSSSTMTPFYRSCSKPQFLAKENWWNWNKVFKVSYSSAPSESFAYDRKKKHFSDKDEDSSFKLSSAYYQKDYPHLANFVLQQDNLARGNKDGKESIKGCSLGKMGYVSEAYFVLRNLKSNLARGCLSSLLR